MYTKGLVYVNGSWLDDTAVVGEIQVFLDKDWYMVELTGGRNYQFEVQSANNDAGTLTRPWLQ